MKKPLVKICGITRLPDALAAIDAGAGMLGLIFAPASPRKINPAQAAELARAIRKARPESDVQLVGVFQNAPLSEMTDIIAEVGLNLVQLHGDEPPNICAALPVPVIRVLVAHTGLSTEAWLDRIQPYEAVRMPNLRTLLIDLPKGAGGDIISLILPQPVLEHLRETGFFLAGGLHPDNVAEAVRRFRPDGVDVASGVELSPGEKDIGKLQAFCHNVVHVPA